MSSQKGNVKRTRPQKHQNRTAFKNNLHDTSKKTKEINKMEIAEVCQQCKVVIEWKIKYKKYKPLTQPKTCLECHLKAIKLAYHTLCEPCGKKLGVCCKCRQSKEVLPKSIQLKPKEEVIAMMRKDLKMLPERKRRALYRYVDSFYDTKKRLKMSAADEKEELAEEDEENEGSAKGEECRREDYCENYLEKIREKLDELLKGVLTDEDFGLDDSDDEFESDS